MTAKEYLSQIKDIEIQIKLLYSEQKKEAELTFENATNISSRLSDDRVQSSGDLQRMETTIVNGADKDNIYEKQIEELKAKRKSIIDNILKLPAIESIVLYRRYVDGQMLKEIAFDLNKSRDTISDAHIRALKKIDALLSH